MSDLSNNLRRMSEWTFLTAKESDDLIAAAEAEYLGGADA